MAGKIKAHVPDGIHGYGIEYNYELGDENKDASDFIQACYLSLDFGNLKFGWFYQSGHGNKTGYQYFESLADRDGSITLAGAEKVAKILNCEIEI